MQILDPDATETLEGTTVFIFNLPRYALGLPFAPHASQDDGLLDLVVFRKPARSRPCIISGGSSWARISTIPRFFTAASAAFV